MMMMMMIIKTMKCFQVRINWDDDDIDLEEMPWLQGRCVGVGGVGALHALMLMDNVDENGSIKELMCRICHTLCAREADETASWFICSVDPVCCSGYAVCASCLLAPNALSVTSTVSEFDDARKLVSSSKFSADAARTSASCAIIFAPPKHSRCRESRCRIFLGCGQSWRRRLVA